MASLTIDLSFSEAMEGRFLPAFLDEISRCLCHLLQDCGLLGCERLLEQRLASAGDVMSLITASLALMPEKPLMSPGGNRGPQEVLLAIGSHHEVPAFPFFKQIWAAIEEMLNQAMSSLTVGGPNMQAITQEALEQALLGLKHRDMAVLEHVLSIATPGTALGAAAVAEKCSLGAAVGEEEASFWMRWVMAASPTDTAQDQQPVPLLLRLAATKRRHQAEMNEIQSLVAVAVKSNQMHLLAQDQAGAEGLVTRAQVKASLHAALMQGLHQAAGQLFLSGQEATREAVDDWTSSYMFIKRHARLVDRIDRDESDLLDLAHLVMTTSPDPESGFDLRVHVVQLLLRCRGELRVRDLPLDLWQILERLQPEQPQTFCTVVKLLIYQLLEVREEPSARQLGVLLSLVNDSHAASPHLGLGMSFRLFILQQVLGAAEARQVSSLDHLSSSVSDS